MKRLRRLALLCTATLAGLAVHPTQGADGTLAPERRPVAMSGAERWRLRPAQAAVVLPVPLPAARPVTEIPEARRNVRVVYPALTEAR